jgi:hypothetical protein
VRRRFLINAVVAAVTLMPLLGGSVSANVALTQISSDPFANTTSFHATEVEPDTFSFGSTIVSTFQQGRFPGAGSSDVGWATSTDGGTTWTHGNLPGITKVENPANPFDADTDPSVAFDAKHNTWMISSLPLVVTGGTALGAAVLVSRSTNGGTVWSNPVTVQTATDDQNFDKNWTACDNTPSSPHYGNCYTEWDDFGHLNQLHMATSPDGGMTWKEGVVPRAVVIGGQPVVQPNGTVIVPIDNGFETVIESFVSTDGGATYSGPFRISRISSHTEAGNLRSGPLPSAEIDAAGRVFVVWEDCRFERGCQANDIVMSTSTDGRHWSRVTRVPIDAVGSGVDHFLPGLGVDKSTSGSSAHLALTYYFYPNTSCSTSTCQLEVGFVSSADGGASWSTPTMLAGPMSLTGLPLTSQGYMVGDYISTSFNNSGTAHGVFAVASSTSCVLGQVASCNEAMFTNAVGLAAASGMTPAVGSEPVLSNASDHVAQRVLTHR